ncbi:putative serine esterase-domain-containing protein [Pyronema domesticum]|nr:putative serine esterase-domain-containing protein [Pyronema domesticum]
MPKDNEVIPRKRGKGDHLCVFVHGLWGNPGHLAYMSDALQVTHDTSKLRILVVKKTAGWHTYDGIDTCGERVAWEIENEIKESENEGVKIKKISVVGYSLGGLIARYSIGLLYSKGYFDEIEPMNFCTFATPHLGVRTPLQGVHNHFWNVLGARTISVSGRQLFTIDSFRDTGRPLLAVLADPSTIFYKGLSMFKNKTIYANIINDRSVPFYTSSISSTNPYLDLTKISANYVPGYSPNILDPDTPFSVISEPPAPEEIALKDRILSTTAKVPKVIGFSLLICIGTTIYLLNAGLQHVLSMRRIQMHCSEEQGRGYAALPFLASKIQDEVDQAVIEGNHARKEEYLEEESGSELSDGAPATRRQRSRSRSRSRSSSRSYSTSSSMASDETAVPSSYTTTPPNPVASDKTNGKLDTSNGIKSHDNIDADEEVDISKPLLSNPNSNSNSPTNPDDEFPTLALTEEQFGMIENLDSLGIRKFHVWIHNARHSHAAIIMRRPRKSFEEGKMVISHWITERFEL